MLVKKYFYLKHFYSTNSAKNKKVKAAVKRHIENKLQFGNLLKKNKILNEDLQSSKNSEHPEILYYEKSSKNIKIFKKNDSANSYKDLNSTKNNKINPNRLSNNYSLPEIIIRSIESFPLMNNKKKIIDKSYEDKTLYNYQLKENQELISKNIYSFPSVTKVLNATLSEKSKEALERWKQEKIEELGLKGFEIFQKGILQEGKQFHELIQNYLTGKQTDSFLEESRISNCWKSISSIINNINTIRAIESHVIHPKLCYHGIIDCVADYCGTPMIIDWKKSDKAKESLYQTYDYPIQLAAYLGALNYDNNYPFQLKRGLIVVAYTSGMDAHVHTLKVEELNKYWNQWLQRLKLFHKINSNQ